ncbi:MAG: hypothetical protein FJ108_00245 [Deltaproteobacteria bacterium]|nr:hypothetical protein [Deltaproteobacteria bacterium]
MRTFLQRAVVGVVIVAGLAGFSSRAAAVTVDSVGDSFTVNFGGNIKGVDVSGLSASALFEVTSISGNTLVMDITLTNTTSVLWESARVSAFGFNTNPEIVSASVDSTVFANVNLGGQFPNGFGSVDLCVINNRNNCTGGRKGGLTIGQSTGITLSLTFQNPISAVDLDNFGVRYQSLTSSALGFDGASGTGRPSNPIPEPRSTAMYLLGGLLVAGLIRKQLVAAR